MTKTEKVKIDALMRTAARCEAEGMGPIVDDGTVYGVKEYHGQIHVTDGKRWWPGAQLVCCIDVYDDDLVTLHYYLKHLPTLPAERVAEAGMRGITGTDLLDYFDVSETVIFEHQVRDKQGRSTRTVIKR